MPAILICGPAPLAFLPTYFDYERRRRSNDLFHQYLMQFKHLSYLVNSKSISSTNTVGCSAWRYERLIDMAHFKSEIIYPSPVQATYATTYGPVSSAGYL